MNTGIVMMATAMGTHWVTRFQTAFRASKRPQVNAVGGRMGVGGAAAGENPDWTHLPAWEPDEFATVLGSEPGLRSANPRSRANRHCRWRAYHA
jgi:hypothetical protein